MSSSKSALAERARSAPTDRRARLAARAEPWRDWAVLTVLNHGLLILAVVTRPAWPELLLLALPLAVTLAITTLTVLHDAGHRQFSRREWPNVLAVQIAAPFGLWAAHWALKHRVHHRLSQVYPIDESTRSSSLVRLHPAAPLRPIHRFQHFYTWALYSLAWVGELKSQLTYLRTGVVTGNDNPWSTRKRVASFAAEKAVTLLILLPYALTLGVGSLALLLVITMTVGSVLTALVLVVGHINIGLEPTDVAPSGREWAAHLVRTTASFRTRSRTASFLTGGMTLHLAHHLRPMALRSELPALHDTKVADVVAASGLPLVEYPTFSSAVRGHFDRLRDLGRPQSQPQSTSVPAVSGAVVGRTASAA